MTKFGDKTFNGPTWNAPKDCQHPWLRQGRRGIECVKCAHLLVTKGVVDAVSERIVELAQQPPLREDDYVVYANE